jgi:predicted Zn-dependent protease
MEISRTLLRKIQGEYVEIRYSSVVHHDVRTQLGDGIKEFSQKGVAARVIDRGRLKTACSARPEAVETAIRSAKWTDITAYTPVDPVQHYENHPELLELPIKDVKDCLGFFAERGLCEARLESLKLYDHVVTNLGTDVCQGISKLLIRIFFTPVQGITVVYSFGYPGDDVCKGLETLAETDLRRFSDCSSVPSGQYNVVLSPQVTGMIFHEIAHAFEGSMPELKLPPSISLSDNPEAERLGNYTYDSEGCRASQTVLVKMGAVQGCLATVLNPGNRTPTGNGRASGFDAQPIPRQSNLEVVSEKTAQLTEEELLEMVTRGVYIAQVGEGSVFPGGITYFKNALCFSVEKGEIRRPLRNIHFGGNLIEMVKSIQRMGTNYKVEPGVCLKGYQRQYITTMAPSCLIQGMYLSSYTSSKSPKRIMQPTNSSTSS